METTRSSQDHPGQWPKGTSGNPMGRPPKEMQALKNLREVVRVDHETRTIELIDAILADARKIRRMGQTPSITGLIEKHNGGKIPGEKRLSKIRKALSDAGFLKPRNANQKSHASTIHYEPENDRSDNTKPAKQPAGHGGCDDLSEEQAYKLVCQANDLDYELSKYADSGNKRARALLFRRLFEGL